MNDIDGQLDELERVGFVVVEGALSAEEVEIRVVEHLYRWPDYKVVKADMAYKELSPGIIEFRPLLKPGGRRSVHYTVRYSW